MVSKTEHLDLVIKKATAKHNYISECSVESMYNINISLYKKKKIHLEFLGKYFSFCASV